VQRMIGVNENVSERLKLQWERENVRM
jgi:hypothetical protein